MGEASEPRSFAPEAEDQEDEGEQAHEGLLENDLYLLTQGQDDHDRGHLNGPKASEGRRPDRRRRRPHRSPSAGDAEDAAAPRLALPAPADAETEEPGEPEQADEEDKAAELERARKRKKFESKPVEAKREGDEDADWIYFPSLAAAARETGVPNSSVAGLCSWQGSHSGWLFRWPGAEPLDKPMPTRRIELPAEETEAILRRLRAMSAEERRSALSAMPEETRKELLKYLKQEAGGSRLRQLLSHLPELLDSASEQKRAELMQGIRMLEAVTAQVLAAPDMAAVVKILRELTPQQRHAIVESLPAETQEALAAHLCAEKAAHAAQHAKACVPAQQSLLPAFEILKRTLLLNGEGLPRHVSSEQRVRFLASRAGVFRSEHGTLSKKDEDGEGAARAAVPAMSGARMFSIPIRSAVFLGGLGCALQGFLLLQHADLIARRNEGTLAPVPTESVRRLFVGGYNDWSCALMDLLDVSAGVWGLIGALGAFYMREGFLRTFYYYEALRLMCWFLMYFLDVPLLLNCELGRDDPNAFVERFGAHQAVLKIAAEGQCDEERSFFYVLSFACLAFFSQFFFATQRLLLDFSDDPRYLLLSKEGPTGIFQQQVGSGVPTAATPLVFSGVNAPEGSPRPLENLA
ncbi:Methyltransf_21 domain-containing protein [Durusdinium trenchii]|uniref:Methyltransf_21 domain-containing protein n=1 Tax=Durusdinium trenchii TaxID=1381693 RepID=A0ABP0NHZ1_9DINO